MRTLFRMTDLREQRSRRRSGFLQESNLTPARPCARLKGVSPRSGCATAEDIQEETPSATHFGQQRNLPIG